MEWIGEALQSEPFRAGVTFAIIALAVFFVAIFVLNRKFKWWVSADLLETAKERTVKAEGDADKAKIEAQADAEKQIAAMRETLARAHADADAKVITMRQAMDQRTQEMRQDAAERVSQVRQDSQAELDRLIKFVEALQRDVESWKTAWNLADQANREEGDARWDEVRAFMAAISSSQTVLQRFVTELQRQASAPLQLEAGGGERGEAGVV
jgi:F0F1-type ATP synthase membrane subunit b/b'